METEIKEKLQKLQKLLQERVTNLDYHFRVTDNYIIIATEKTPIITYSLFEDINKINPIKMLAQGFANIFYTVILFDLQGFKIHYSELEEMHSKRPKVKKVLTDISMPENYIIEEILKS